MQNLVEDFLFYLRHERGQSEQTAKTYAALLGKFIAWAEKNSLRDWKSVELRHLMSFLQHERERALADEPKESSRRLSRFEAGVTPHPLAPATIALGTQDTVGFSMMPLHVIDGAGGCKIIYY